MILVDILLDVLQSVYIQTPLLIILASESSDDNDTKPNRSLINDFDENRVPILALDYPVYISTDQYREPPDIFKYFKIHKCLSIVVILRASAVEEGSKLQKEVARWRLNAAWSGKASLVVVCIDCHSEISKIATNVISEVWRQNRMANVFVLAPQQDQVAVFRSDVYNPTCEIKTQAITTGQVRRKDRYWNLHRCQIHVATTELTPFVFTTNASKPLDDGLEVMLFKMVQGMMNFTYKYEFSPPGQFAWTTYINNTPAGLLGLLDRREADVMFHGVRVSWDRFRIADALDSYYGGGYVWAAPLPENLPEWQLIYHVFHPLMWAYVIASLVACALCIWKFQTTDKIESFIVAWGLTFSISQPLVTKSVVLRIVISLYMVYIVTISAVYQAGLFEMLSQGITDESLQGVNGAIDKNYSIALFPTMAVDFRENDPYLNQKLIEKGLANYTTDSLGSFRRIASQQREIRLTIDLLIHYENNLRFTTASGTQFLTVLSERFSSYEPVFYMPRDHPLMPSVKEAMRRLVEAGWVGHLKDNLLYKAMRRKDLTEVVDLVVSGKGQRLSLKKVLGAFSMFLYLIPFAVVAFSAELILRRNRLPRRSSYQWHHRLSTKLSSKSSNPRFSR